MTALQELADQVGTRLQRSKATIAVAESATGGMICSTLTDIPGSSTYFEQGVVAYANDAKQRRLGVSREVLDRDGAVSERVAEQLAQGVRDTAGTTWGLATTGIAGPTGGTDEKPVGTVFIAVAYAGAWGDQSSFVSAERYEFEGDRAALKTAFSRQALTDVLAAISAVQD